MQLTVGDRMRLVSILKGEGSIDLLLLEREIRNKVALSDDEKTQAQVKLKGDQITWSEGSLPNVDVTFSQPELEHLKERVRQLDQAGKFTPELLDLALKIRSA